MENIDKYNNAFLQAFGIDKAKLSKLKYQDIKEWDSVGHMNLIGELEDIFDIEMDIDDITDFSSYEIGQKILKKYKIK
jgi:acyl carrier protein